MNLEHRQPFGEGNNPSHSEALLAGKSFHQTLDDLFKGKAETQQEAGGYMIEQMLDLKIIAEAHEGIIARLYRQTFLDDGGYMEWVSLYEYGTTDEDWGRKICSYASGSGTKTVTRYDAPSAEVLEIADRIELTEDNALDVLRTAINGQNLEATMGLNDVPVGVEEGNGLRELLLTGVPLRGDNSQK